MVRGREMDLREVLVPGGFAARAPSLARDERRWLPAQPFSLPDCRVPASVVPRPSLRLGDSVNTGMKRNRGSSCGWQSANNMNALTSRIGVQGKGGGKTGNTTCRWGRGDPRRRPLAEPYSQDYPARREAGSSCQRGRALLPRHACSAYSRGCCCLRLHGLFAFPGPPSSRARVERVPLRQLRLCLETAWRQVGFRGPGLGAVAFASGA